MTDDEFIDIWEEEILSSNDHIMKTCQALHESNSSYTIDISDYQYNIKLRNNWESMSEWQLRIYRKIYEPDGSVNLEHITTITAAYIFSRIGRKLMRVLRNINRIVHKDKKKFREDLDTVLAGKLLINIENNPEAVDRFNLVLYESTYKRIAYCKTEEDKAYFLLTMRL